MALDDVMPAKVTYIDPSRVLPVDNEIEYEAFDAVADKLLLLLGNTARRHTMEDYEDGGYPAEALNSALCAIQVPIPRSAVDIIRSYIPKLNEFNDDWFGVEEALDNAIERCGIDESA
ncbi:hypothetical protein QP460_003330 [Corynebacterium amycolatum]|uniref:Uncharacterized protein n=1 Tax=Corynebacterium amycolatum TaxID=43765 RepID=A0AAW9SXW5_CORAY|nr:MULTISPECIES: hypothetical protein [Corynebacterium]MDK7236561.1 hypothetical protein [Corynebacterium amycolatum]MDK7246730.1 hypothetical protein [Corynebacterium amycolatum]OHQ77787.1 hypothetical protein HMPREF2708_01940 [Corynebacterium sp. HMSC073H12]OHR32764.1 hypothetical protein HMPREF3042_06040 [Corynebacterium sp. HMSC074C05]